MLINKILLILLICSTFLGCTAISNVTPKQVVETCLPPGIQSLDLPDNNAVAMLVMTKDDPGLLIRYTEKGRDIEILIIDNMIMGIDLEPDNPLGSVWIRDGISCNWKKEYVGQHS